MRQGDYRIQPWEHTHEDSEHNYAIRQQEKVRRKQTSGTAIFSLPRSSIAFLGTTLIIGNYLCHMRPLPNIITTLAAQITLSAPVLMPSLFRHWETTRNQTIVDHLQAT
jgi:hypothetical protein